MVKKLLVTTALEETWRTDMPIVFLGEWCRLYKRKALWGNLDHTVIPYHWDDREVFYNDYNYVREVYENLLVDVSHKLNQIHNVNYSVRYWRILIGPWLGYFTQILFDRWNSINYAKQTEKTFETIVFRYKSEDFIPKDMIHFTNLYLSDEWNHFIYSSIIKNMSSFKIIEKDPPLKNDFNIKSTNKKSVTSFLKTQINSLYAKAVHLIAKSDGVLFFATYQSLQNQAKLYFKFSKLPIFNLHFPPKIIPPDQILRQWKLTSKKGSKFENFIRQEIANHIPIVYLEGYKSLYEIIEKMPWPAKPKIIFTSNGINSDEVFKMYTAFNVEKGTPLAIGQHGGHYGAVKWSFIEEHEVAVSDKFFSWGWTDFKQPSIESVGIIKPITKIKNKQIDKSKALLVTTTQPRYSSWMYSSMVSSQWIDYFQDQCNFVRGLNSKIQSETVVRLYTQDYGWNQLERWVDEFPHLTIDKGNIPIIEQLRKCRIFIATYNATTFLETFAMDIPTVMFWNEFHWELRESAIPYYEELKRVGVFHSTPESAAAHINTIWDNVEKWWYSYEVKIAVNKFSKMFCDTPENISKKLELSLKKMIVKSENE